MVNKNVKALPAPDTKTAWVSAPLRAFGHWSKIRTCGLRWPEVSRRITAHRFAFSAEARGMGRGEAQG